MKTIPVKEITSRASALRMAAAVVQSQQGFVGCCYAFSQVRGAVYDAERDGSLTYQQSRNKITIINRAQSEFREAMTNEAENPYRYHTYWMGPLDSAGRKRRTSALLMMAEAV